MEERTVEGHMHIIEPVTIKGVVTLTLFDEDGNEVCQQRNNLVTDALKQRILGPLAGIAQTYTSSTLVTRFGFGTSNAAPTSADVILGREVLRKPVTSGILSGNHFIADCNIAFSELNTLVTTLTAAPTSTSITVASVTGLSVGDVLEINPVNTVGVTTNAQFVEVSAINPSTKVVTLVSPGLNMTAVPAPASGWYAMQVVREAGTFMSVGAAIVQSPITSTSFVVSNPSLFSVGQYLNIQTSASTSAIVQVNTVVGSVITVTNPMTALPIEGSVVECGILANHATGFTFRKTNKLTAIARVDFSMD